MSRVKCCYCGTTVGCKKALNFHIKGCEKAKKAAECFMKLELESETSKIEDQKMTRFQKAVRGMSDSFKKDLKQNCLKGAAVFCSTCDQLYLSKRTRTSVCKDDHFSFAYQNGKMIWVPDYQKVCKFHYRVGGCRNGPNCKYQHIDLK